MKSVSIKAKERKELGKKSTQALRKDEQVPCVLYGGEKNIHFYAPQVELKKIIYTNQVYIIDLDIDGTVKPAVIKDLQFHPVSDEVLHIDFMEVVDGKPTTVALPVILTGTSAGILAGGKLRLVKRYLTVKGLIADLPEALEIDITEMNIGDVKKIADLSYDKLELLEPGQSMVVGIATSRLATLAEDEEEGEDAEEVTEETTSEE